MRTVFTALLLLVCQVDRAIADPPAPAVEVQWRWSRWIPPVVGAGGGAVTVFGFVMLSLARGASDERAQRIATECAMTPCDLSRFADLQNTADREQAVALVAFGVGAATIATGITLYVLNEPRVVPVVTPTPGGASAGLIWRF